MLVGCPGIRNLFIQEYRRISQDRILLVNNKRWLEVAGRIIVIFVFLLWGWGGEKLCYFQCKKV